MYHTLGNNYKHPFHDQANPPQKSLAGGTPLEAPKERTAARTGEG